MSKRVKKKEIQEKMKKLIFFSIMYIVFLTHSQQIENKAFEIIRGILCVH